MSPSSTTRRLLGMALAALAVSSVTASAASAGSFEQVSRATGAAGWAPFTHFEAPILVSDSGRHAIFRDRSLGPFSQRFYLRDIVLNTTTALDERIATVYGMDRAERTLLVDRRDGTGPASTINLVAIPLTGGTPRVLLTTQSGVPSAAISGDGRTVAYSLDDGSGTFKIALPSGTKTQVDAKSYELGPRSLSDDGSVLGGADTSEFPETGAYWRGSVKSTTPGRTIVSPNGAIVATSIFSGDDDLIVAKRLSDGLVREYPIPGQIDNLTWIAPDGLTIVSAAFSGDETPAQVLNLVTGQWAPFAGPFAESIQDATLAGRDFRNDAGSVVFSRSGRYATVIDRGGFGNGVYLLSVAGGDLPGVQESPSPSAYLSFGNASYNCGDTTGTIGVNYFVRPTWMPRPQRADVTILADGEVILQKTFTQLGAQAEATFPTTAKAITYRATVKDSQGVSQTTAETIAPRPSSDCG